MKKVILLSVSILLICLAYSFAEVPCKINYQGRLIKDNVPVDGQVDMEFSLYTQPIGGTLKKTISINNVPVYNGLFRAVLDLEDIDWTAGETMYLEVKVGTDILTPREAIYAYPYAINSHLLEGATKEYFLNISGETQKKDGGLNIMGNLGIGTTSPMTKLNVVGSSLSDGVVFQINDTTNALISLALPVFGIYNNYFNTRMLEITGGGMIMQFNRTGSIRNLFNSEGESYITGGNVGIGTTSPGEKLTVAGTIESTSGGVKFPDGSLQTTANPKGWVYCNSAGTIQASYNVSSVTKNGKGDYTVNWNTGFSSANYAVAVTPVGTSGRYSAGVHTLTAGSARIRTFETYNGWNEDHDFHVVAFGAQ